MIHGTRIIESLAMVDHEEDWSRVRSQARARRRRSKHRQNIAIVAVPKKEVVRLPDGSLVAHPAVVDELRRHTAVA